MSINPFSSPGIISLVIRTFGEKIQKLKSSPVIIAIDGHSSSGKSTLANDLSNSLDYRHLDSGAMYRAFTLYLIQENISPTDEKKIEEVISNIHIELRVSKGLTSTFLNDVNVENEIRSMRVSRLVSEVSAISAIRKFLVNQQNAMGREKGIVMDGRDIGTVVFPHAEIKLFVTASLDIRALRRFEELKAREISTPLDLVITNIEKRDLIDSTRLDSPLKKAPDSIVLDTSYLNREEQLLEALRLIFIKRSERDKD